MQEKEIFSQGIRAQKTSTKHQTLQQVAIEVSCVARNVIVFNGVRLRCIDGWQIVKSKDGWPPKTMNFDKSDAKGE